MDRVQRTPPLSTLVASNIKAYALPLLLFNAAILYHLFLNSSPPSHYQVLQIESNSSIQAVHEAYRKLESKWNSDVEVSDVQEFIKLYSLGSNRCAEFSKSWNKIASLLDGVANIGAVELGEKELAVYLADKRSTRKPFLRNGVPSLIAIPPRCHSAKCFRRFDGELTVDEVTNWVATNVLNLPQIYYYFRKPLILEFFGKMSDHKVKVIFFSKTGERASPFIRQAAKDYRAYASFAFIHWREEDTAEWQGAFGVESAPAIIFLEDLGIKPVVHHGSVNDSFFRNMMENNKQQELKQLRRVTLRELGCDHRYHSLAGCENTVWYCAIAVGRPSLKLNRMRETMRRVQRTLSKHGEVDPSSYNQSLAPVVDAFKRKRLTFSWLDGEKQAEFCAFHLRLPAFFDSCGEWMPGGRNIPRLFIVQYQKIANKRKPEMTQCLDRPACICGIAGQLKSVYEGQADVSQIIEWLTYQVKVGDSLDVTFNKIPRTPELIPDDTEPYWFETSPMVYWFETSPMVRLKSLKQSILYQLSVYREDPKIVPALLLGALVSFSTIWLRRSQRVQH